MTPLALPEWAEVTRARRAHIARVAEVLERWATLLRVNTGERNRWLRAAALHDALKDAPVTRLRELAPDAWGEDDLRHGPAAAVLAQRHGERDGGVLDAVRYHSVGYAGWDQVGRLLYVADYVEPGRRGRRRTRDAWLARLPAQPDRVLCEVAADRIERTLASGRRLLPETEAFRDRWCGAPRSG
jgi:HD superfamily phosphohydrolase YqeK